MWRVKTTENVSNRVENGRAVWCVCVKASSAAGYEEWEAIDRTCIRNGMGRRLWKALWRENVNGSEIDCWRLFYENKK
jgi:hypothetical protein